MGYLQGYDDEMGEVLADVRKERFRQEELFSKGKFPWACDDPGISDVKKLAVLAEEFGEASKEAAQIEEVYDRDARGLPQFKNTAEFNDEVKRRRTLLRAELIQVAAVCVAWCEALDRQVR